ncbi:MAG: hypothetical protein KHY27_09520 [Butyricicoccus pullicaecorum]|nr:hypothetical protein [Butyricicoccus pullicaecorum]
MNTSSTLAVFLLTVLPAYLSPWLKVIIYLLLIVLLVLSIRYLHRLLHPKQARESKQDE